MKSRKMRDVARYMKLMSKGIIQKERRNLKNVNPAVSRFARIIGHFFPHFPEMLDNMDDPRHLSYITYPQSALIMLVLMKCVSGIDSMRGMTREFNTDEAIHNLSCLCKHELDEKSDWQTINDYLERLDPSELQEIIHTLVKILIRTKAFAPYTILGKYPVLIDGTDYAFFRKKHSEHDLVKKIEDKETGEVTCQYFNKALEAKILLAPGLLISIATEFIENEDENVSKQDCELNAGYRLIRKLKKFFPKLDIIIIGDALYAVMPFMKAVQENRWDYIFRVKAGRQSKLMEDFDDLLIQITEDDTCREVVEGEKGIASFVNHVEEVTDKPEICNMVHYMYRTEQAIKEFNWVSNIEITQKNVKSVVKAGRSRWLVEAGFNVQKNGVFVLEHHCSRDYNAMKNHYLLVQIAHMFMQLYMSYDHVVFKLKEGIKHTAADLFISFTTHALSDADIEYMKTKTSLHLCISLVN